METRILLLVVFFGSIGVFTTGPAQANSPASLSPAKCVAATPAHCRVVVTRRAGNTLSIESPNFTLRHFPSHVDSQAWADAFESLRQRLLEKWIGPAPHIDWSPKCEIVLHGSLAAYRRAVGAGAERTVGSTLISFERGKLVERRIDVLADKPTWFEGAVAHELTHVVLAEVWGQSRLPAWADEGIAVLADPQEKQRDHLRDLNNALRSRNTFRLVELVTLDVCPAGRQAEFYGQSASLVQFLLTQGTPDAFVRFVRVGMSDGYDAALRGAYHIDGLGDLERRWRDHVSGNRPFAPQADAVAMAGAR